MRIAASVGRGFRVGSASPTALTTRLPLLALLLAAHVVQGTLALCHVEDPRVQVHEAVLEGHRPLLMVDHLEFVMTDALDPVPELLQVRDRRRESDESDVVRCEDQALLPNRAAVLVVDEVDLVEDHEVEIVEAFRILEHRVAEDLGRHDHERRVGIEREVTGHQADAHSVVLEVAVLLVAQRLDRARVDHPALAAQRLLDRVLRHQRLSGAGRCGDQNVLVRSDRRRGLHLK